MRLRYLLWIPLVLAVCTPPQEDCATPGDEDGNRFADCADDACWVEGGGCPEVCSSFFDEDADGVYGCFDSDCWVPDGGCTELCDSPNDEDGDGAIGCADPDCWILNGFCNEDCSSDNDEDGDGYAGCSDDECWGDGCEEVCTMGFDEDGDGLRDCADPDCADAEACIPTYADVKPIFDASCGTFECHSGDLPTGQFDTGIYDDMLKPSYYCPGMMKGECTIVRILDNSMPPNFTLPQDDVDLIQRWIDGGLLPSP